MSLKWSNINAKNVLWGPGYWDRLADRVLAEGKAEGGGITMEEFLGLPAFDELPE